MGAGWYSFTHLPFLSGALTPTLMDLSLSVLNINPCPIPSQWKKQVEDLRRNLLVLMELLWPSVWTQALQVKH